MRHPTPALWADLALGRLREAEKRRLIAHAEDCAPCREARRKVEAAKRTLVELRETPPVDLRWDRLLTRINWSVESELRRRERAEESRRGWARRLFSVALGGRFALVGAVAMIVIVALVARRPAAPVTRRSEVAAKERSIVSVPPAVAPDAAVQAKLRPLEGIVTFVAGTATLEGGPLTLDTPVTEGATLVTATGRLGVQFGERAGFVLEPHSSLELVSFNEAAVELRIVGAVTVDVTKRRPDQRLAVLAGRRTVDVRGTHFRVANRDGLLDVAVARGRVAVVEGGAAVEIPAGERLALALGDRVGSLLPRHMSTMETAELADVMRVPVVAGWTGAASTRLATAVLDVAARGQTRVRVDGVGVGGGSIRIRTIAGRHLVEVGVLSSWVEVDAGGTARTELPVSEPRSERPLQVDLQLEEHRREFAICGSHVRKADPTFEGEIEVEIGINADGTIDSVSPVSGLPDREIEACILNVLRNDLSFPRGSRHTVVKKISF